MLHVILQISVLLLFFLDIFLLLGMNDIGILSNFAHTSPLLSGFFILLGLPIFYLIVYKSYIRPIQKLNQSIARFMTGIDEDPNLDTTSWSK
jgi:hypothetical protein